MVWYTSQTSLREQAESKLASIWDRAESGVFPYQRFGYWRTEGQGDPGENALCHLNQYSVQDPGDWRQRDDIRTLPESDRVELEIWLLEQVLRYGHALIIRPDSPDDWRRGLALLERTATLVPLGPLVTQCRLFRERLKLPEPTAQVAGPSRVTSPPRWMEEYLRGIEAELGQAAVEAQAHYENVLEDRPESFWGHYRAAVVAYELNETLASAVHLKHCVDRRPQNPVLRDRLAGRLYRLERFDEALDQCNKALMLDPDMAESYRTRTLIRGRLGQTEDVIIDTGRFELLTRSRGKVPSLKLRLDSMLSLGQNPILDPEGRGDDLSRRILAVDPEDVDVRRILARRFRDAGFDNAALAEYDKILELNPEHLRAAMSVACCFLNWVAMELSRDFFVLLEHPRFEEFIREYPSAISIFHYYTEKYLREGEISKALQVAERGLAHAIRIKAVLGSSHYVMARAYALASLKDPGLLRQADLHLKAAEKTRPKDVRQRFEHDPAFHDLRSRLREDQSRRKSLLD